MNTEFVLITKEERDYISSQLRQAAEYCRSASTPAHDDFHVDSITTYAGAAGWSLATMELMADRLDHAVQSPLN